MDVRHDPQCDEYVSQADHEGFGGLAMKRLASAEGSNMALGSLGPAVASRRIR